MSGWFGLGIRRDALILIAHRVLRPYPDPPPWSFITDNAHVDKETALTQGHRVLTRLWTAFFVRPVRRIGQEQAFVRTLL
jgi:hypothetical protein